MPARLVRLAMARGLRAEFIPKLLQAKPIVVESHGAGTLNAEACRRQDDRVMFPARVANATGLVALEVRGPW